MTQLETEDRLTLSAILDELLHEGIIGPPQENLLRGLISVSEHPLETVAR